MVTFYCITCQWGVGEWGREGEIAKTILDEQQHAQSDCSDVLRLTLPFSCSNRHKMLFFMIYLSYYWLLLMSVLVKGFLANFSPILLSFLQSNLNGSNIFGTMEICLRHG